jgi:hypothetical protein
MSRPTLARIPSFACLLIALSGLTAAQTTWHVNIQAVPPGLGTPAQPYTSIQYAIDQAATVKGDTLLVAPGVYEENIDTSFQKGLVLRSTGGPLVTTIRPAQAGWVVRVKDMSTVEGFTVSGKDFPGFSQGILAESDLATVRRCIVRDHDGDGIGAFYDAKVEHCTVTGNGVGLHAYIFGGSVSGHSSIVTFNNVDLKAGDGTGGAGVSNSIVGADPSFWNYEQRDLNLRPGSIAIDAGQPAAPPDPDGSVPDAGALIYDPNYVPGGVAYCTGKLNSQGCVPAIGAIGSASASSAAPFVITADQKLPGVPGLLFFGFAPRAEPFQGAWHCVEPPTPRVGGQVSAGSGTCGGTFSFDMNAYIQSGMYPSLVPGEVVYCQWWSRDLQDPAGFGTGLTNALYFGIAP